ncbi:hypothetical protein A2U01_0112419, partial [Trifolium medium]|nr:hypothetical protein [Trifolium medium]
MGSGFPAITSRRCNRSGPSDLN